MNPRVLVAKVNLRTKVLHSLDLLNDFGIYRVEGLHSRIKDFNNIIEDEFLEYCSTLYVIYGSLTADNNKSSNNYLPPSRPLVFVERENTYQGDT